MSDIKVSVYPGFVDGLRHTYPGFTAGWCLPKSHSINVAPTTTTGTFDWLGWAQRGEQPALEETPIPLESLVAEYPCPVCQHPPTMLNEAQDRCERDGRLTCYRCGWKGPA